MKCNNQKEICGDEMNDKHLNGKAKLSGARFNRLARDLTASNVYRHNIVEHTLLLAIELLARDCFTPVKTGTVSILRRSAVLSPPNLCLN